MDTERSVLTALGGSRAVADSLGLKQPAVSNWLRDGIPYRHWPALIDLASRKNVAGITLAQLSIIRATQRTRALTTPLDGEENAA